jgi:hypothetical protein
MVPSSADSANCRTTAARFRNALLGRASMINMNCASKQFASAGLIGDDQIGSVAQRPGGKSWGWLVVRRQPRLKRSKPSLCVVELGTQDETRRQGLVVHAGQIGAPYRDEPSNLRGLQWEHA